MDENYEILINKILKYYEIGDTINGMEVLDGGFQNINIKFGVKNKEYVLKIYNLINFDFERIEGILNFLYDLKKKHNYPVAEPMLTKKNEPLLKIDKNYYSISKFIIGSKFEDDFAIEKIISAGKTLASLHKKTIIKNPNEKIELKVRDLKKIISLWDVSSNAGEEISLYDKITNKKNKSEIDKSIIEEYIPYIKKYFNILLNDLKYIEVKKRISMIHGDYWGDN